jgi:hypothetical protein
MKEHIGIGENRETEAIVVPCAQCCRGDLPMASPGLIA